jgi:LPXTG-motif cell wall-anchored protein
MKTLLIPTLLLALSLPAFAQNQGGNRQGGNSQGGYRGAPGPVIGAGLPLLLIGGGIYWLARRRKKAT